jgi:outer membrane lipoprotein-sorting protein
MFIKKYLLIIITLILPFPFVNAQTAEEIVKRSDELIKANSSYGEVKMKVIKPDWSREMTMKMWALEPDYALILITAPAKDKGIVTLKRKTEVWNWIPGIHRIIKIPPSMMLQSWMGSDFTNDDLVKQSSIVTDYHHKIIGEESFEGYKCYKIELTPKENANVVWGKIITWISKKIYLPLRSDYYDEDGYLIKKMIGSKVKKMGGRIIPTLWEMIPQDTPGQKTVMEYMDLKFNIRINSSFFSQKNMKHVR